MPDTLVTEPTSASPIAPVEPVAPITTEATPGVAEPEKKKLSEMASWDELVVPEAPAEPVAEAITREDGSTWNGTAGRWQKADGTFAQGAAPDGWTPPVVDPAAPVTEPTEPEAPAVPVETVALRTRDGQTREIEVDDPELAELLRTNANDGMRASQYREKVAALDAKLEEVNAFRAMVETNPEAVVLQHMPAEKQVSIAVALIAQHWDQIVPLIQQMDGTEGVPVRMATAMQAQEAIRTNQALYERKLDEGKYVSAITQQVQSLIPEGTPDATVQRFLTYAGQDLAQIVARDGRIDPATVPTHLAETVKLFGFAAPSATPSAAPRAAVRFASAQPTPSTPTTSPTAARPVGDAAVALAERAKQAAARTQTTQAARARAAAVPPSGAGAAPVRLPSVPKGADIRTASQTLRQMGNSWGPLTG